MSSAVQDQRGHQISLITKQLSTCLSDAVHSRSSPDSNPETKQSKASHGRVYSITPKGSLRALAWGRFAC